MIQDTLSVIIPAYNEEALIKNTLFNVNDFLKSHFKKYEIIVVNDASTDSTEEELLKIRDEANIPIKIIKSKVNIGKGGSIKKGIEASVMDYILFLDADLSTPIEEVEKCLAFLREGYDIAIGSRALPDSNIVKSQGIMRRNMGRIFNMFVKSLLFGGIQDTQCGFKCFRKQIGKKLFRLQRIKGFCFDAEILFIARKYGFRIKEIPVTWSNVEDSRVGVLKDSFLMFLGLFLIRLNDIRGLYNDK